MDIKKTIITAAGVIAFLLLVFLGYFWYMNKTYKPGIENLSKENIGIFYCSYNNDGVSSIVDTITQKLKADKIEIKPAVPYPTDENAFMTRIKKENEDVSKVVLNNNIIDIRKYKLIILGTPILDNHPCPVMQKFVITNEDRFDKKPVSMLILYKDNQIPKDTAEFFRYKLYHSIWKPSFVTTVKEKNQLDYEIDLWFNLMEFKREELR